MLCFNVSIDYVDNRSTQIDLSVIVVDDQKPFVEPVTMRFGISNDWQKFLLWKSPLELLVQPVVKWMILKLRAERKLSLSVKKRTKLRPFIIRISAEIVKILVYIVLN